MAEIEKKVDDLTLNPPAADKPQGKPKEKKAKKPVAEGSYPLEVLSLIHFTFIPTGQHTPHHASPNTLSCSLVVTWLFVPTGAVRKTQKRQHPLQEANNKTPSRSDSFDLVANNRNTTTTVDL